MAAGRNADSSMAMDAAKRSAVVLGLAVAVMGAALALALPVAWIALGRPGRLECSANFVLGWFTIAGLGIGDRGCRALLALAAIGAAAVVVGLAWLVARRAYARVRGGSDSSAP